MLSTAEPVDSKGSTKNYRNSLSDPYVFNTAITRAQSLVIAVGNPFRLLTMEDRMMERYGTRGKRCWSKFLDICLKNSTIIVHSALKISNSEKEKALNDLEELINDRVPREPIPPPLVHEPAGEFEPSPATLLQTLEEANKPGIINIINGCINLYVYICIVNYSVHIFGCA